MGIDFTLLTQCPFCDRKTKDFEPGGFVSGKIYYHCDQCDSRFPIYEWHKRFRFYKKKKKIFRIFDNE